MLQFGLRLGGRPRQVVTTTPRPTSLIKRLIADPRTAHAVTHAGTAANARGCKRKTGPASQDPGSRVCGAPLRAAPRPGHEIATCSNVSNPCSVAMVIASRELTLREGNSVIKIPVRIFAPVCENPGVWGCRYEVDWPGEDRTVTAWGVDGVQSIFIAFQMIGAEIYTSDYHKAGNLFWDAPGNGYGFPVSPTLRDLLRGDDLRYL
jgi:hypothetical protein